MLLWLCDGSLCLVVILLEAAVEFEQGSLMWREEYGGEGGGTTI